jgi:hypothetical protein
MVRTSLVVVALLNTLMFVRDSAADDGDEDDSADEPYNVPNVSPPSTNTIDETDLGRPCDASFHPIRGYGLPIFRPRDVVEKSHDFSANFLEADDTNALRANAEGWFISGNIQAAKQSRYLVYRASQTSYVRQVDDSGRPIRPIPPDAVWYIASISYGHSYEVVVSGDKTTFTAGVRAQFKVFGGGVSGLAERRLVVMNGHARGFRPAKDIDKDGLPDGTAFPATDAISTAFVKYGEPVVISVEYRHIPGAPVKTEQLDWAPGLPTTNESDTGGW